MEVIIEVEKIHSRYRILLDNGETLWFSQALMNERPLHVEESVDAEELKSWLLLRQYRPALEKSVTLLAKRAHSQGEIRQKLKAAGYMNETADMVLCKLDQNGLVNDEDFAGQWIEHRTHMRYGPHRIQSELKRKGLDDSSVEVAMESLSENEINEIARDLIRRALRRKKPNEDPRKARQRILSSVVRRGFSWDTVIKAWETESEDTSDSMFPDE